MNNISRHSDGSSTSLVAPSTFASMVAGGALLILLAAAHGGWLPDPQWLRIYAVVASLSLLATVVALRQVVRASGGGTSSARGWRHLFVGVYLILLGQCTLMLMRFANESAKAEFPSLADVFYVAGQILFISGLSLHLLAYARSGLPLGSRSSYVEMYLVVAVLVGYLTWKLNLPMWADPANTFGWKTINTTYHVLDMLTLCAALGLLRIALVFRGGSIAVGWAAMATGALLVMIADMLFGIGVDHRYAALVYLAAYVSLMFGAMRHREVIAGVGSGGA